ncbi:nuclear transport factor 2 family protein [Kitasatospora sp. NPDC052868]|uniref:nuclear transport factor 2 family protein n=1 Tax=Kitasatospora sp. NPDC052868 TaxID=3364060 RepID=UPI0037C774E3
MYHAITRARVRSLWRRIGAGDYGAAVSTAAPGLRFRFVGDTPISTELTGRDAFEVWFRELFDRFPGLRFTARDVVVRGWPWDTTVVVRLDVAATLSDGTPYRNETIQWIRLRWGRMVSDEILEDTKRLDEACRRQEEFAGRQ